MMNKKRGFTMAEALSVLVLLGVVAAITIPTTISKHIKTQNRVRIQKAMATYDSAIRLMVSENRITTTARLNSMSNNNCRNIYNYFKAIEQNGCQFKTTDGVWWDMSNVSNPIIAFKRADLIPQEGRSLTTNNAFYLNTEFDDRHSLRINDISYLENNGSNAQYVYLQKTYNFIENKKNGNSKINVIKYNAETLTNISIAPNETKIIAVDGADKSYFYKITSTSNGNSQIGITKNAELTAIKGSNIKIEEDNGNDFVYIEGSGIDYKGGNGNKTVKVNLQGTGDINIELGNGNNNVDVNTYTTILDDK